MRNRASEVTSEAPEREDTLHQAVVDQHIPAVAGEDAHGLGDGVAVVVALGGG